MRRGMAIAHMFSILGRWVAMFDHFEGTVERSGRKRKGGGREHVGMSLARDTACKLYISQKLY